MKLLLSTTNALNKWLKADLPRLPAQEGQRVGVHGLVSDEQVFCWQLHIIDNAYKSGYKTIIACEANSRFTMFIPVTGILSLEELTKRLLMEWQYALAETLQQLRAMPNSDTAVFLSDLSEVTFETNRVKNTDISISGHISDASIWITQTIAEQGLDDLPSEINTDLSIHLNTQMKRTKNERKKFMPIVKVMDYCQGILMEP
ncbi:MULTISPECIES: amino acid adenylation [unclassified Shewanella]|uniref:amino acid adenylation n=1 Tax=Shewanella TaxID=22 RepID=UPI0021D9616B|nr:MULTISPECIES: amino acid adenylation [unclassified Shewanella]MCU7964629.1 amino acid adenylation [Shewanella sp. SW32]MCU7972554.1 amino acid adenylation [Shewanella sp. SW29]MCU8005454.1 amino acid adenylation [Shewanella sp. SM96]MCU8060793.1 amino acid adenylation [Shewanella sp. SM55]